MVKMNNPKDTTEYLLGQIDQTMKGLQGSMDRIEGRLSNQHRRLSVLESLKTRVYYMSVGAGLCFTVIFQLVKSAWGLVHH